MRNVVASLLITAALFVLGTPAANAGATCKVVPSWCPPAPGGGGGGTGVPEPATIIVLAAGAGAAALAARRRNKK